MRRETIATARKRSASAMCDQERNLPTMKCLEERHDRLHRELQTVHAEVAFYSLYGNVVIESNIAEIYQHSYVCDQFVDTHGVEECLTMARGWLVRTPLDDLAITEGNRSLTARAVIMISLYAGKAERNAVNQLANTMTHNLTYGFTPRLYVRRRRDGAWSTGVSGTPAPAIH